MHCATSTLHVTRCLHVRFGCLSSTNLNIFRVYPDAPRLEPSINGGTKEQEVDSDGESDDDNDDDEEPSSAKKKRVVLKRNFRRHSQETKNTSDPKGE